MSVIFMFLNETARREAFADRASFCRWSDPARHAYESAVETLRNELTPDEYQTIWLRSQTSMQDAQDAVTNALKEYQAKTKGSRVRTWLASCSSRVMYYGEYVSLAWGTLKFLFIAVINHEELLVEISKTVSRIADVLPRTELHSVLYPTQRMQDAVSQLYAKIIEFIMMAVKWYKKGKLAHSLTAITKPFNLGFKPIIEDITERSRRIDELASAASKAELRDLHISIHGLNKTIVQLTEMSLLGLKEEHRQMFTNGQLEGIRTSVLLKDTPAAEDSLAWCRSMRNRRRQKAPTQLPVSELSKLKHWVSDPSSSLLLAEGQGVRTSSLDFAADFLDTVTEQGYPVLWALPSTVGGAGEENTGGASVQGILRSLISQALSLNPAVLSEGANPLTAKHFKTAASIQQWFKLLERCVSSFARLFIVIDIRAIQAAVEHEESETQHFTTSDFVERVSQLVAQRSHGGLKIVIVSWRFNMATSMDPDEVFRGMQISTDRGRKVERLMKQPKFRALFRRRHHMFSERFKSSVNVAPVE
ncbi:Nacht domain protein [Colletotrichum higginsianum IMI 349063]|uniref:Nacht domain protein n=1 Tax=Colletotrichum higginsianum (strain IMI 349063) TaxID=759273 RepID=A0A1B7YQ27_COLHI|nr:Nacht domain protein [Colletotrichum higginsianum IMI 349063]OBR14149.1 Nacht domain protein [Colletotrichum higginsianum IMI 349063]